MSAQRPPSPLLRPALVQAHTRDQLVLYGQQFMQVKQTAAILPQPAVAGMAAAMAAGPNAATTAPGLPTFTSGGDNVGGIAEGGVALH